MSKAEAGSLLGCRVEKVGGSYSASGTVVAEFETTAGRKRVVFEFDNPKGLLHIFDPGQLHSLDPSPVFHVEQSSNGANSTIRVTVPCSDPTLIKEFGDDGFLKIDAVLKVRQRNGTCTLCVGNYGRRFREMIHTGCFTLERDTEIANVVYDVVEDFIDQAIFIFNTSSRG